MPHVPPVQLQMTRAEANRKLRNGLDRYRKGDMAAAHDAFAEVLIAWPDHATALHYMALVIHASGDAPQAIELLRRSIRIDSKDPRAYNHLGQMALGQKQTHEAIACFRRAIEVDPRHVESINNLANVLALNGQRDAALDLYRRALELEPRSVKRLVNLANAFKDVRAYDEAEKLYERAVGVDPSHVVSHHNLGVLLEQRGRFAAAAERYRTVQRLEAGHVASLANLLALPEFAADEQTLLAAEERVADLRLCEQDRIRLHHGLGRHYDRAGRYEEAFRHHAAAKSLVRARSQPFDAVALEAHFSRLIETFSAEYFAHRTGGGSGSQRLVFIVGMPRSGTTLTEQILASHPGVYASGETQTIPALVRSLSGGYPQRFAHLGGTEISELARDALAALSSAAPASAERITDKLPVNFMHLGVIATLFPHSRIIHCQRAALDTALSCYFELFRLRRDFSVDLEMIGEYFLQYQRLMTHWRQVLPLPMLEQRYEELIAAPESGTRALIAHCDLPWDETCLNFQSAERAVATPSRWQVRQPIYSTSVGRWLHYQRQLAPLRALLEGRGYQFSG